MNASRIVDFFEINKERSVLTEIEDLLTETQLARFRKNVQRLEEYGWALDGSFFGEVKGIKSQDVKLKEYRLTLDKVELRVLFSEEKSSTDELTFVMLSAYKEKRNSIPPGCIASAKARLATWRDKVDKERVRTANSRTAGAEKKK